MTFALTEMPGASSLRHRDRLSMLGSISQSTDSAFLMNDHTQWSANFDRWFHPLVALIKKPKLSCASRHGLRLGGAASRKIAFFPSRDRLGGRSKTDLPKCATFSDRAAATAIEGRSKPGAAIVSIRTPLHLDQSDLKKVGQLRDRLVATPPTAAGWSRYFYRHHETPTEQSNGEQTALDTRRAQDGLQGLTGTLRR